MNKWNVMFLTDFELVILLAVLRVADNAYGVSIANEIERPADGPFSSPRSIPRSIGWKRMAWSRPVTGIRLRNAAAARSGFSR
jgi:hypothetical protein